MTQLGNEDRRSQVGPQRAPLSLGGASLSSQGAEAKGHLTPLRSAAQAFLDQLIELQLVVPHAVQAFLAESGDRVAKFVDGQTLGSALVEAGLLTPYLLDRIRAGTTYGLVLGNYRVLERIGGGGVAIVFAGEHLHMRRRAAIKVLPVDDDFDPLVLERFYTEMRVLADLHHPNIITAFDAGHLPPPARGMPALHYLVMELVDGGDIEEAVCANGPATIAVGCDWIRQAACGLQEAHDHHLIHRDIKPSNMLLTKQGHVKLVDFGLARQFSSRLTSSSDFLGTVEFMAPEQSRDPTGVSGPADIYGLGASLLWILSGQLPHPQYKNIAQALRALQKDTPRRLRDFLPDAPQELDDLIAHMLERDPAKRPELPIMVVNALTRFAARAHPSWEVLPIEASEPQEAGAAGTEMAPTWCSLALVTDPQLFQELHAALETAGCACVQSTGRDAVVDRIRQEAIDLIVLDMDRPDLDAVALCRRLREHPPRPHLKILTFSAQGSAAEATAALKLGSDGHVARPIEVDLLRAMVQHILLQKDAQVRADQLAESLLLANQQLEQSLEARSRDIRHAEDALLFGLSKMVEFQVGEPAGHTHRLQQYCRVLGAALAHEPSWAEIITPTFLEQLERIVPLHDIGKLGLPDTLLGKPAALTIEEREMMETHTLMGAGILDAISRQHGEAVPFLANAAIVVRYHHERYDGEGYPDGLAGDFIPPAARLVAVADVYDALRRQLPHKPALSHQDTLRHMARESGKQFDPAILRALGRCHAEFDRIFREVAD